MEYKISKKAKSEIILNVTHTAEELKSKYNLAAEKISENMEIKGFRKGKAPLEIVIRELGEMAVCERAAEILVSSSYSEILTKEQIEPLTQPSIAIEKIAPGNEFNYKATLSRVPEVSVGDLKSVKVNDEHPHVTDEEVAKVIDEIRESSASETLENRPAQMGDKVDMNFDVFRDGVPIEHGQGRQFPLILGKQQMIPGFEEAVVGMKATEEKEVELSFPEKYYNKNLAGKKATFRLKLNGVFKRTWPETDDAFAKTHGHETLEELKKVIRHNLEHEQESKLNQKLEIEITEKLINKSTFGDIPDSMVNNELDRMIGELKRNISSQGMKYEDYLEHLKKDELALRVDLAAQALTRVKASLLTRAVYFSNNLTVTDAEIDVEMLSMAQVYQNNPQMLASIKTPDGREWLRNNLASAKVMSFLKNSVTIEHNH